jgi:exodeoxyribonuclease III
MKVVTWNVNSLKARNDYVQLYLDTHQPDVLCIQELKLATDKVPVEIFTSRGYEVAVFGQKQWNGVMIASKFPISNVHKGLEKGDAGQARLIACTIKGVHFVNLYCPQGQSEESEKFIYKKLFYDCLIEWVAETYDPSDSVLLLGDFNIAPEACDVYDVQVFKNVPTYHPEEHARWSKLIEWGLEDVGRPYIPNGMYTFWDYRAGRFQRNQGMRIDHFLGTVRVKQKVVSAIVNRDFRKKKNGLKASDHAPVELLLSI